MINIYVILNRCGSCLLHFFFLTEVGYCLFSNVVFFSGWLRLGKYIMVIIYIYNASVALNLFKLQIYYGYYIYNAL
jgi:hypothetical protein